MSAITVSGGGANAKQTFSFTTNFNGAPVITAGVAEVDTLTITSAATSSGNVVVTLDGTPYNIAVASSDTTTAVASKIAAFSFVGFTANAVGAVVTFTASAVGIKSAPVYSAGSTGATGNMVRTTIGN